MNTGEVAVAAVVTHRRHVFPVIKLPILQADGARVIGRTTPLDIAAILQIAVIVVDEPRSRWLWSPCAIRWQLIRSKTPRFGLMNPNVDQEHEPQLPFRVPGTGLLSPVNICGQIGTFLGTPHFCSA